MVLTLLLALLYPLCIAITILTPFSSSLALNDDFTESLHLRPLPLGRVHSTFTFTLSSSLDPFSPESNAGVSFHLLPPSLLNLLHYSPLKVKELHISFNKGRWDHRRWGMPTFLEGRKEWGTEAVANGIEARVLYSGQGISPSTVNFSSFETQEARRVEQGKDAFHNLLASLSGQLCSTLSAAGSRAAITAPLDLSRSLYTSKTDPMASSHDSDDYDDRDLLYTLSFPEPPCTEVLYRTLTLLPCRTNAGLATLLEPHHWLKQEWHGLELLVSRTGEDQSGWQVKITVGGVWNGVVHNGKRDFSFSEMYGKPLAQACPLAKESFVSLLAPSDEMAVGSTSSLPSYEIEPPLVADGRSDRHTIPTRITDDQNYGPDDDDEPSEPSAPAGFARSTASILNQEGSVRYITSAAVLPAYIGEPYAGRPAGLDVSLSWPSEGLFNYSSSSTAPVQDHTLHISRSYISSSLTHSIFSLRLRNERPDRSRRVVYREVLPWFLLPSLPSAALSVTQLAVDSSSPFIRFESDFTSPERSLLHLQYRPSIPRVSAGVLELELRIPPSSEVRWEMQVGREVIRYEEHNPDAHRGLEVGAGSAWEVVDDEEEADELSDAGGLGRSGGGGSPRRRRRILRLTEGGQRSIFKTEVGLVEVAVPDFSMPYNVIIFTSTLLALFAGSAVNLLTRSFRDVAVPPMAQVLV